ncbi:hypothetical protein J3R82DRAFT_722 [Butyriboletus roseoflavus]|nr:hypothetical protein J3R82DRAFT_722 [Butyriboletus roseoflavus]
MPNILIRRIPETYLDISPYTFNQYDGAILPVTITGFVPDGSSFFIHPPSTGTSFTWIADVAAGTTIIFTMTDAQGRSGGSSDTEVVALSNNASCLTSNSPTSTVSSVSSSTSAATSSTSSPTQTSSGVSTNTIVGAAVGAVVAVTVIIALAIFYLKRHRYGRSSYGLAPAWHSRRPNSVELDPGIDNFQHPPIYPFPYQIDSASHLAPPTIPGSSLTSPTAPSVHASELPYTHQRHSRANSNTESFAPSGEVASSSMSSNARRKAGMTIYHPTRFILHTDAEDHGPGDEAEVVELPPQYSERRATMARHTGERPVSSVLSSTNLTHSPGRLAIESPQSTPHPPPE